MFRRISIFLLCLLLLGGSLWQMHYFRRLSRTLGEELSRLERSAAQDPASMQTEAQLSTLRRVWEENIPWLCMLLPHAQIDAIHLELLHLENLLSEGESVELETSFAQLSYLFAHLRRSDAFSFGNVF